MTGGLTFSMNDILLSQILIPKSQKCHPDVQKMTDPVMCDTVKSIHNLK